MRAALGSGLIYGLAFAGAGAALCLLVIGAVRLVRWFRAGLRPAGRTIVITLR
jgi:hypothetical protein